MSDTIETSIMPTISLPGVSLELDTAFLLQSCYVQPDDIVVVAGTLIEGIGNAYSDIDVYVFTNSYRSSKTIDLERHHRVISLERDIIRPETDACNVLLIHTVVPGTSIKVDVEFKTFAEVDSVFDRLREIYRYAARNLILLTKRLTDREEVMIHRLFNCIVLRGADAFQRLMGRISKQEYLYVAYRWVASDFAILLDLAGAWDSGDVDRAVELARENVFIQTSGYLRLRGVTSLRRKWLLTYLRRLPDTAPLLARFLDLAYLRDTDNDAGKRAFIARSLDFVDYLFELSSPLLAAMPGVPSGESGLRLLERDRANSEFTNEYAAWEYEYRTKAYGQRGSPTRHRFKGLASI
ncbi:hypothetical protein [Burkholderia gladioli]|uniref:hypothetical protein n=1 Tax=Burkholderia gladioli TaxID=28095 RepID=UPI0007C7F61F|nr:hypothetical protein [Burkholderia gladioli]